MLIGVGFILSNTVAAEEPAAEQFAAAPAPRPSPSGELKVLLEEHSRNERKYAEFLGRLEIEKLLLPERLGTEDGRLQSLVALRHVRASTVSYYDASIVLAGKLRSFLTSRPTADCEELEKELVAAKSLSVAWLRAQRDVVEFARASQPRVDRDTGLLALYEPDRAMRYAGLLEEVDKASYALQTVDAEIIRLRRLCLDQAIELADGPKFAKR